MGSNSDMQDISESQFKKAQEIAREIRSVIALRDKLIRENKIDKDFALPSESWNNASKLFSYCLNPSYEIVNTWRLHMLHFSGFSVLNAVGTPMPAKRRLKYRYLTDGVPQWAIADPPLICAELGWKTKRGIVNMDVFIHQGHLSTLYRNGVFDYLKGLRKKLVFLDIGGGYGGLAYFIKNIFPDSRYYLVDLPGSLLFSAVYLGITHDKYVPLPCVYDGKNKTMLQTSGDYFTFVPNFLISDLLGAAKFDLVVNTGSFGEMTPYQVNYYAEFIKNSLAPDGVLYEDNFDGGDSISRPTKILGKYFDKKIIFKGPRRLWSLSGSAIKNVRVCRNKIKKPRWLLLADMPIFALRKARELAWWVGKLMQKFGILE